MTEGEGSGDLSRREFTIAAAATGLAVATGAQAAGKGERAVEIKTADGTCDAVLVAAASGKAAPAVILYPDAMGLRPAMVDMAKRIAAEGYAVLAVNQFYRSKRAPILPPGASFGDPATRAELGKVMGSLNHDTATKDAQAFIAFLDQQPEVDTKKKIGAVGFCMGGAMTIRAAAIRPDRVGACASFHGGGLATDDPNSPHKLVAKTSAAFHIGIAAADDEKEPDAKVKVAAALDAAKRPYSQEVYVETKHGWTVTDSAVYDKPQAERAYSAMIALYKQALV